MVARLSPLALAVLLSAGVLVAVQRLWPVAWPLLWPFAAGALYAEVMEPSVQWLCSRGISRATAAAGCLATGMFAAAGSTVVCVFAAWNESLRLRQHLQGWIARGGGGGGPAFLQRELDQLGTELGPAVQHLTTALQHFMVAMPGALLACFVAFASAYFAMRDREQLVQWLQLHLGSVRLAGVHQAGMAAYHTIWGIVRAQLLLALGTFATALAGLVLIGAPYAVLAALGAALLDFLPIVGPGALFVPWMIGEFLGGRVGAALALGAVFGTVGLVRWLWTPRLLGAVVGLHPFVALAAMYVGSRLLGLAGLLVGPLGVTVLVRLWTVPTTGPLRTPVLK